MDGLRASEVCDLQWQQIELSEGPPARASEHGRTDAGKSNSRASDLPYNAVRFVRRPVLFEVGSEREQEILVERSARSLQ